MRGVRLLQNKLICVIDGEGFAVAAGPQETDFFCVFGIGVCPLVTMGMKDEAKRVGRFAATGRVVEVSGFFR